MQIGLITRYRYTLRSTSASRFAPGSGTNTTAERLNAAKELCGIDDFTDMIGGETLTAEGDPEAPAGFLTEKGHPAPGPEPMM